MYGYIYITENLINGKKYIGKRQKPEFDKSYLGSGLLLSDAIKKYGKDNFKSTIIDAADSLSELNLKEKYWIKFYNAVDDKNYYNLAYGGDGGNLGPDAVMKISQKNKGRHPWNYGLKDIYSDEYRLKLSESHKNKKPWNCGLKGVSEETSLKMCKAKGGTPVMCIDTGESYRSSSYAELCTGIAHKGILKCCRGLIDSYKGTHWKFLEGIDE